MAMYMICQIWSCIKLNRAGCFTPVIKRVMIRIKLTITRVIIPMINPRIFFLNGTGKASIADANRAVASMASHPRLMFRLNVGEQINVPVTKVLYPSHARILPEAVA